MIMLSRSVAALVRNIASEMTGAQLPVKCDTTIEQLPSIKMMTKDSTAQEFSATHGEC
jgi:hypothetical protein